MKTKLRQISLPPLCSCLPISWRKILSPLLGRMFYLQSGSSPRNIRLANKRCRFDFHRCTMCSWERKYLDSGYSFIAGALAPATPDSFSPQQFTPRMINPLSFKSVGLDELGKCQVLYQ